MNINTALYLADVFDDISGVCGIFLIIGSIVFAILIIARFSANDDEDLFPLINKALRKWPVLLIFAIIVCLTPSKNTVYMMMASSYLESSSLPPKVAEALELKIDKYIAQLRKKDE